MFLNVRICLKLWELGVKSHINAGYESINGQVGEENLVLNRTEQDLPAFTVCDLFERENAKKVFGEESVARMPDGSNIPAWKYYTQLLLEAIQDENKTGLGQINLVVMEMLKMPKE